jgi:hypothetical protein
VEQSVVKLLALTISSQPPSKDVLTKRIVSKERLTMGGHISKAPADNCVNPDSYGLICVHCNKCGRFEKEAEDEKEAK